ncbi:MAG: hypothetical protein ACI4QZ_05015 [Eubacteriales bacterium]
MHSCVVIKKCRSISYVKSASFG